jgi:hypothetical protein
LIPVLFFILFAHFIFCLPFAFLLLDTHKYTFHVAAFGSNENYLILSKLYRNVKYGNVYTHRDKESFANKIGTTKCIKKIEHWFLLHEMNLLMENKTQSNRSDSAKLTCVAINIIFRLPPILLLLLLLFILCHGGCKFMHITLS